VGQRRIVELVAGAAQRLDQDAAQLGRRRGGDQLQPLGEPGAKGGQRLGAQEEVVAQGEDDADRVLGRAGGAGRA